MYACPKMLDMYVYLCYDRTKPNTETKKNDDLI